MFAQEQKVADSLVKIYREGNLGNIEKLELLRNLSFNEVNDLDLSLKYAEESRAAAFDRIADAGFAAFDNTDRRVVAVV